MSSLLGKQSGRDDTADRVYVQRTALAAKLRFIDLLISQKRALEDFNCRRSRTGIANAAFNRLKDKEGKFDGQLCSLYVREYAPDGPHTNRTTKTICELESTIRANRPHLEEGLNSAPPRELSDDQQRFIEWYRRNAPPVVDLDRPEDDVFVERIAYSNDSGVGTDKVPNAFYRIDPILFAVILAWEVEYRECNNIDTDEVMNQLLTWIPKALAGLNDDNWRPLCVPTTWLRLLTGGVVDHLTLKWPNALDQQQTLAGKFKEAHANYRKAQSTLEGIEDDAQDTAAQFTSVLFTDLVKAFELLNPRWVWAVLEARNAPRWLKQIVLAFTSPRTATAKILGRLMKPVHVNIGVDMGNALAPWIFCLALDPLIRYANRIPGIIRMQGYMDDTNSAGKGPDWLEQIQRMWGIVDSAGLHIARHTCCQVMCNGTTIKGESYSTIIKTVIEQHGEGTIVHINGALYKAIEIIDCSGQCCPKILRLAFENGCSCKGVKTKLLLRTPPTDNVLQALDNTPYGMMILDVKDRCLGLTALTPNRDSNGKVVKLSTAQKSDLVFEPYLIKVEHRAERRIYTGGVVHHKIVDWKSYTVSKILYPATQYRPTEQTVKRLNKALAQTINIGPIIEADKLQPVLRAIGITGASSIRRTLDATIINAVLRQHGHLAIVGVSNDPQVIEAVAAFDHLRYDLLPEDSKTELMTGITDDNPKRRTGHVKRFIAKLDLAEAIETAVSALKPHFAKWTTTNDAAERAIAKLNKHKLGAINVSQRMSWLRWLRCYDHDAYKRALVEKRPKPQRKKQCHICDKGDPLKYPYGYDKEAFCDEHCPFERQDFLTKDLAAFIQYDPNDRTFPRKVRICNYPSREMCTLCHAGQATIRHWVHECPVVTAFITKVGCPQLPIAFDPGHDDLEFGRVLCCLHQVRLLLIRDRCIGLPRDVLDRSRKPTDAVKELLEAYVRYAHPALNTASSFSRMSIASSRDRTLVNNGLATVRAPAELRLRRPGEKILAAAREFQIGDDMIIITTNETSIPSLLACAPPLPNPSQAVRPNAHWRCAPRSDGNRTYYLKCCAGTAKGDEITTLAPDHHVPQGTLLLARFDGSYRRVGDRACAGCGVVIYVASNRCLLEEVAAYATPLPGIESASDAEAIGALKAGAIIAALLREPRFSGYDAEIQGDHEITIGYQNGHTRINSAKIFSMFQPLRRTVSEHNLNVKWTYIPREHNPRADQLAKAAAKAVADGILTSSCDADGALILPARIGNTATATSAPLPVIKSKAIDYLRKLEAQDGNRQTLILPERYRVCTDDISPNLPIGMLVTVLKFLRARGRLASYGAAAGHDAVSRHYARDGGIAGSGTTKKARYMLLQGHYEADISSCFHTVIRCFAKDVHNPLLAPLRDAIAYIIANISINADPTVVPKTILQRIITAPPSSVRDQIRRDFGVELSPDLFFHMNRFQDFHKDLIVSAMKKKGFIGHSNTTQINNANKLYFPCEAAETSIMTRALQKILQHDKAESVVWLHDGMYVNDQVPCSFTSQAIIDAAAELGIDDVLIKITSCNHVKHDDYGHQDETTYGKRASIANEITKIAHEQSRHNIHNGTIPTTNNINLDKPLGRIRNILVM